jgi:nucleoside-diphosphate-sugar epimerase
LPDTALVTGALGCIGAWTVKALLDEGAPVVAFDLGENRSRLELVLSAEEIERVAFVQGDVTDLTALERALDEHEIGRVVHLAALQVPFCRADPPLGARVNVVGTVNVFEAVKRRAGRIPLVAYASSTAVYGPDDPSPAPESGGRRPATHYGVYKTANEGTARVYFADDGVPSIGIRPYVVYGPGRDQGMTAGPTLAMAAAARGEPFEIAYGGRAQYDYARDVGASFAAVSRAGYGGAGVFNFPGARAHMSEVVSAIEAAAPEAAGTITFVDTQLPFPADLESGGLEAAVGPLRLTPLTEGVHETVERFRALALSR